MSAQRNGKNTLPSVSRHATLMDAHKPARTALSPCSFISSLKDKYDFQETFTLTLLVRYSSKASETLVMYDFVALSCLAFSQAANNEKRLLYPFLLLSSY